MGVPTDQMSLELLGRLLLFRAWLASADETPLPVSLGNVVGVPLEYASGTYPTQADICCALGAVFLFVQLPWYPGSIAQTTPRALPSAVARPGSSQLPLVRWVAPESSSRVYQFQFALRQRLLSIGVSKTVPGFRHPATGTLPCAANDMLAMPYDTEDVGQVIPKASPIFGNDTSTLFQMGMAVGPKRWHGTQRNLTANLSARARTNGMMKENWIWHSHLAVMLGHGLPAGVRQWAGGSSTQPKNSGSDKSGGQEQAQRQVRKRKRSDKDDDEEPESNYQKGSDNGSNVRPRTADNDEYLCPYYFKDEERHKACWKQKWRGNDLRKLKEHLEKKHLRWVCNYCFQAFEKETSFERHTHVVDAQRDYLDGFDHGQSHKLKDKSRFWGKTGKEYWDTICEILFPHHTPPSTRSGFTWEESQYIRQQNHELRQRVLDWLGKAQDRGWIQPDGVSSLTDIIEGRCPSISIGNSFAPVWQRSAEPEHTIRNYLDRIDSVLPSTRGGGIEPMNDDHFSNIFQPPASATSVDETAPSSFPPFLSSQSFNSQNHDRAQSSPCSSPPLDREDGNSALTQVGTEFIDMLDKWDSDGLQMGQGLEGK
ncbi:hypothetical protein DV736_g5868, partial [Chaetothyriales sp. CBS 134916]